jgi:hypothetical protein
MGIKETVAAGVDAAFSAIGNLTTAVTYKYYSPAPSYDPATATLPAPAATIAISKALILNYKKSEIGTFKAGVPVPVEIRPQDRKVKIRASEFGAVVPALTDRIDLAVGETWNIVRIELDPTGSLYTFQVRRP